jgi:DNA-binding protein H-NS
MATSLQELLDQKIKLERQISELQNSKRGEAITAVKALMAEHGLTVADLSATGSSASKAVKTSGKKVAAKYRDPETGVTWTGRGLKPKWMAQAIANGKQVTDFAI